MTYPLIESGLESGRWIEKDEKIERVQKLEETLQYRYAYLLGKNLPEVKLHIGGAVQEELREIGAVAAAHGNDIYIREEAYQEGSTGTDAIMLHELTHVMQSQGNKQIQTHEELNNAEEEAERNEILAAPIENAYYYARIDGHLVYLNDKIAKASIQYAVKFLKERLRYAAEERDIALLSKIDCALRRSV